MKITEVDENTFRASIETRFNNVRKCTTLPKLIQFLNVIEATESSVTSVLLKYRFEKDLNREE